LWSPGKHCKFVFDKFGSRAKTTFASRLFTTEQDIEESDDGVGFRAQIDELHAIVNHVVAQDPALKPKYDELCILRAVFEQLYRGACRGHDLFLVRLFATLFGGEGPPWKAHDGQAFRYDNGACSEVNALNIQQALRIEEAITKADACLQRMSHDKNMHRPTWNPNWFLQLYKHNSTDSSNKKADESFSHCQKLLREALSKFLQFSGGYALKLFCKWRTEPKKAEPMLAFKDLCVKFLPGQASIIVKKTLGTIAILSSRSPLSISRLKQTSIGTTWLMATLYGEDKDARTIEYAGEAIALLHNKAATQSSVPQRQKWRPFH